jgi:hypothetical protein
MPPLESHRDSRLQVLMLLGSPTEARNACHLLLCFSFGLGIVFLMKRSITHSIQVPLG